MKQPPFRRHIIVVAATVVIIAAIVAIARCTENEAHLTTPKTISASPTQIKQIRDIGQWEFLSIDMEELVDTIDKKMIGSRRLERHRCAWRHCRDDHSTDNIARPQLHRRGTYSEFLRGWLMVARRTKATQTTCIQQDVRTRYDAEKHRKRAKQRCHSNATIAPRNGI